MSCQVRVISYRLAWLVKSLAAFLGVKNTGTCRNQKPLWAIFNHMVPKTLYPEAFYFWPHAAGLANFGAHFPFGGPTPREENG